MRPIRRTALSAAAVVLAVTLTACSSGDDADASKTDDSGSQETEQASDDSGDGGAKGEAGSAEAAGLDMNDLPDPIASQDIPATVEGDDDAKLKVDLFALKRQGETVVAQFGFTVNSSSTEEDWLYGYLGDESWDPFLVDSRNLRKHQVLKHNVNRAQTTSQGPKFKPGQTYYAFAVFAAPPPDVQEVEVSVVDGMNLVTEAKIS
ncbi:hypothetical protein [Brevibacterium spongiae]|uniref:DUF4352 domain-containing protein n=1 Tax=Brevibacterium spongiae TaxID=2909672 RepID=A0ABY5SM93_9MICO|nr:hypothetical protein [Brevibacterium spongiae]UVI35648.1 hypothetical protein L1F31_16240 [Brevibacterium spongiae]